MGFRACQDSAIEGAVAEGNEERIDWLELLRELDRDGAGAFGDCAEQSVLDVHLTVLRCMTLGHVLGLVEVIALQLDPGAERAHALDLERVCAAGGEDGEPPSALATRVGHALPEVAGRRADKSLRDVTQSVE